MISQYGDIHAVISWARQVGEYTAQGKILDFYSLALDNTSTIGPPNYNILLIALVAIFIAPFDVMTSIMNYTNVPEGVAEIYISLIIAVFYLSSIVLLRRVLGKFNINKKEIALATLIYTLSPVMLFATVGFVQLDIIYVCVVLLALERYADGKMDAFCLIMSVGITLKMFPLLLFIPLILITEKNLVKLMRYVAEGLGLPVLIHVLFERGYAWEVGQNVWGQLKNAPYMTKLPAGINGGFSIFTVGLMILCIWCYYRKPFDKFRNVVIISSLVYSLFSLTVAWNPQYLVMYMLSLVLVSVLISDKHGYYCLLSMLGCGYIGYVVTTFTYNVDNYMFYYAADRLFYDKTGERNIMTMYTYLTSVYSRIKDASVALFIATLLIIIYIVIRYIVMNEGKSNIISMTKDKVYRALVYMPIVPLIGYFILAGALYYGL